MSDINYEQEVKKVYPDAWCYDINNSKRFFGSGYHLYRIQSVGLKLCASEYSKESAWKSAYYNIKTKQHE